MIRIGAHMSATGGVATAVRRAVVHDCEALQIFSRNASRWQAKPLDPEEVEQFRRGVEAAVLTPVVSHASYLINLATTNAPLRIQSVTAFADELARARELDLLGVVVHPGTCTAGTETEALRLVADGIREALQSQPASQTMVLLENTAGQGRTLGYRFDHLAEIIHHLDDDPRIGVCLDTCHLLASGYDLVSKEGYQKTFDEFEATVGFTRLRVVHANDSRKPLGSRVDRHEHIGEGFVGEAPFRRLMHDARFEELALLLETEKTKGFEKESLTTPDPLDTKNLETLRRLRTS